MKALITVIFVLLATFTLTGCFEEECETPAISSTDTPYLPDNVSVVDSKPGFKTVSIEKSTYGRRPSFIILVANISDKPGERVRYVMQALKDNTIINTDTGFFASGEKIMPGEKAREEAYFSGLNSHDEYDSVRYVLR